jgi:hypothetical protein
MTVEPHNCSIRDPSEPLSSELMRVNARHACKPPSLDCDVQGVFLHNLRPSDAVMQLTAGTWSLLGPYASESPSRGWTVDFQQPRRVSPIGASSHSLQRCLTCNVPMSAPLAATPSGPGR